MAIRKIYIRKKARGEIEHKSYSIRIPLSMVNRLNEIAMDSGWSRNAVIIKFIENGLNTRITACDGMACGRIRSTRGLKGEDAHHTFSLRIPLSIVRQLNEIASNTGKSRNAIIAWFIYDGLSCFEILCTDNADNSDE